MERPAVQTKKPISASLDAGKLRVVKKIAREKSAEKPSTLPLGVIPSPRLDGVEFPPPIAITSDMIGIASAGNSMTSSAPVFAIPIHTASKSDDGQLSQRMTSQPALTSPRKSQSAVALNEAPKPSVSLPPTEEKDEDDINELARKSFKKRASQMLSGVGEGIVGVGKGLALLTKRKSKKNLDLDDITALSVPPPPPLPEIWQQKDDDKKPKKKKSKTRKSRYSRASIAVVTDDLFTEFGELRTEVELIIKAQEQETNTKMTDPRLKIQESPDDRLLEKMLENPFQALFKINGKQTTDSIALAPNRFLIYKSILIPNINLNSISHTDKQQLLTLEFDSLELKDNNDEPKAYLLLMHMFHHLELTRHFKITDLTLLRFITTVAKRYRDVPFHNFFHAFNVTQTLFYFLTTGQARQILGPLEQLALLIAAICHDCDHPGLNNDFQRKAQTRVAHLHKKSILENHHYLQCMAVLSKSEGNLLANLNSMQTSQIYVYLRDLILATDLAMHGLILKDLTEKKKILNRIWKAGKPSELENDHKTLIMCALMKCSDLSNEIRQPQMAKRWAGFVLNEFFAQSAKEKELALPVTPFMDGNTIIISQEQINFIEKLCLPLYDQISVVFPVLETCVAQLKANKEGWEHRRKNFFSKPEEIAKLMKSSIWEREQVKEASGTKLSEALAMRASGASVPKGRKNSVSLQAPPAHLLAPAQANSTGSGAGAAAAALAGSGNSSPTAGGFLALPVERERHLPGKK